MQVRVVNMNQLIFFGDERKQQLMRIVQFLITLLHLSKFMVEWNRDYKNACFMTVPWLINLKRSEIIARLLFLKPENDEKILLLGLKNNKSRLKRLFLDLNNCVWVTLFHASVNWKRKCEALINSFLSFVQFILTGTILPTAEWKLVSPELVGIYGL